MNCEINDEHILSLIQSGKLVRLEVIDLTQNHLEKVFTIMMKYFREQCDRMECVFLRDNPGLKNIVNNYQIAKAKKNSGLPMLRRLELSRSLKGDQHMIQLMQGSYMKDLMFLNVNDCRLSQKAFNELIASP